MDDLLMKLLVNHAQHIVIKLDTTGEGYEEHYEVQMEDLPQLLSMYAKFGDDGVLAFISNSYHEEPAEELINETYRAADAAMAGYKFSDDPDDDNY